MKEIPLTRGLVALVDDEDYEGLARHKWYASNRAGSPTRSLLVSSSPKRQIKITMGRQIMGLEHGDPREIEFVDGNTCNNQKSNIRVYVPFRSAELSRDRLKELFNYDAATGNLIRRISVGGGSKPGDILGSLNGGGYIDGVVDGVSYRVHRLVWLWFNGVPPESHIDHINGVRDDNRIENLRLVTPSQNQWNRPRQKSNHHALKGITYRKDRDRWVASIRVNGKKHYLGYFNTPEEAHAAYCKAASELHGEFARYG